MYSFLTFMVSLEPYNIIVIASSGIFFIGVLRSNPYLCPTASIWLNIQLFLYSPRGAMPPFLILIDLSGIILSRSISDIVPSPLHFGQAP